MTNYTLEDATTAYLYGLALADGHLSVDTRNRGRLLIELGAIDHDIIDRLDNDTSVKSSKGSRVRSTNFGTANFVHIAFYDREFRDFLVSCGFPTGAKSKIIDAPIVEYSDADFWRGFIDGDGSLGLTSAGVPFVSLVTISESMAESYTAFLKKIVGVDKQLNRNKRDGVFNIMVNREDAVELVKYLYYEDCIALERKSNKAHEVLNWQRPSGMKRLARKQFWTDEQDEVVVNNSVAEAAKILNRTESSISNRRTRLRNLGLWESFQLECQEDMEMLSSGFLQKS